MAETPEDHLADLLVDSITGRLTESKRRELLNWGQSDPEAARLISDFDDPVIASEEMAMWARIDPQKAYRRWRKQRLRKKKRYAALVAAPILLIAGLLWWRLPRSNVQRKIPLPEVVIPPAKLGRSFEQKPLTINGDSNTAVMRTLPDGTKVWLNANSKLDYPAQFSGDDRVVELSGEAYFDVIPRPEPFIVKADEIRTRVLGTRLDVAAYRGDSIRTTLIDGGVEVTNGRGSMLLKPGEQMVVARGSAELPAPRKVDLSHVVGWKDNFFYFRAHTGLRAVVKQIAQWYDVEPEYRGAIPDHQEDYGGKIQRSLPLEEVLEGLQFQGVRFRVIGRKLIIESNNTN